MTSDDRVWLRALREKVEALERGDWLALALVECREMTGFEPVDAVLELLSDGDACVTLVMENGVRLRWQGPQTRHSVALIASCLACWADVACPIKFSRSALEGALERRASTFCDRCLLSETPSRTPTALA